jgi:hypothetical protein
MRRAELWAHVPEQGWLLILVAYTPVAHSALCVLRDYYISSGYCTAQVRIGRGWGPGRRRA